MGTRTGTFCKDDEDLEDVAALFDAFSDVSYTDWLSKISGVSYKNCRCDDCDMFQLCRSVLFCDCWPGASGDLGKLDDIEYVGDNDFCIDHLQHTEADVIVEQMGSAHHSDDADATFQELFIGAHLLIIVWSVPAVQAYFINGGYGCVSLEGLENALLGLWLRTNSEIYQVVDKALKMGHGDGINGLRKLHQFI